MSAWPVSTGLGSHSSSHNFNFHRDILYGHCFKLFSFVCPLIFEVTWVKRSVVEGYIVKPGSLTIVTPSSWEFVVKYLPLYSGNRLRDTVASLSLTYYSTWHYCQNVKLIMIIKKNPLIVLLLSYFLCIIFICYDNWWSCQRWLHTKPDGCFGKNVNQLLTKCEKL